MTCVRALYLRLREPPMRIIMKRSRKVSDGSAVARRSITICLWQRVMVLRNTIIIIAITLTRYNVDTVRISRIKTRKIVPSEIAKEIICGIRVIVPTFSYVEIGTPALWEPRGSPGTCYNEFDIQIVNSCGQCSKKVHKTQIIFDSTQNTDNTNNERQWTQRKRTQRIKCLWVKFTEISIQNFKLCNRTHARTWIRLHL